MALSTRSTSRPAVGATRARQGPLGRPILWVLLASLALVVIGFLGAYAWHAGDFAQALHPHVQTPPAARNYQAPQPSAATRQNYQVGGVLAPNNHGNPGQPNRSTTTEP